MAGNSSGPKGFWEKFSPKQRAAFVLALCALALLASVGIALLLVRGGDGKTNEIKVEHLTDADDSAEEVVTESGYNKNENAINGAEFDGTILAKSEDAGEEYLNETLFLGDSNTARMYRLFDYCTYGNAIGSVGMSASSLEKYSCVQFQGYANYVTMPQAVAMMQPRRVIITFGTNDLSPSNSTENFISRYEAGILAVEDAYPYADIIINSIPPLAKEHSNSSLTQSQVDAFNKAIVEMCRENGWMFLNSAEVLKDASTGYAKAGYMVADGIHMTETAMDALFEYIRTHAWITEDRRPALMEIPKHVSDKDVAVISTVATTPEPTPTETPEPTATPEPEATATPTPTPQATEQPQATETPQPTATPEPTATAPPEPTEAPSETATPVPSPSADPDSQTSEGGGDT